MGTFMDKKTLRQNMKKRRAEMADTDRVKADGVIRESLKKYLKENNSKWVLFYISYGTEVDTRQFICELLGQSGNDKVRIAAPKVNGNDMEFYEIHSFSDLTRGYMGILEPKSDITAQITDALMIMPGLVFDRNKNRIGYGGGYYDRYLAKNSSKIKTVLALAYDFQVLAGNFEAETHDIKPDIILTEKGIYK